MKNTKGNRLNAAKIVMLNMAEESPDDESRKLLFFYAGMLEGLNSVSGFLSSNRIDDLINDVKNNVHAFEIQYTKEMDK